MEDVFIHIYNIELYCHKSGLRLKNMFTILNEQFIYSPVIF